MTTFEHEYRTIATRPRPRRYASLASDGGKPCPTCYAQMTLEGKSVWMCPTHGEPSKP